MSVSDEKLMAFADGELSEPERSIVAAAVAANPQLAQRVADHRALRGRLQNAFANELREPMSDRLIDTIRAHAAAAPASASSTVVDLKSARAARDRGTAAAAPPFLAMAASLLLGLGVGFLLWRHQDAAFVEKPGAGLVASGSLARALGNQLTADSAAGSAIDVGLSFRAKTGEYCRAFQLRGATLPAGLACHDGEDWKIQMLVPGIDAGMKAGQLRTAGSTLPPEILHQIESQIDGDALDGAAEAQARANGWRGVKRPDSQPAARSSQ